MPTSRGAMSLDGGARGWRGGTGGRRTELGLRSVLIVEADDRLLRERADQLLMDGYEVHAASTAQAARIKLAEAPDALVLCSAGTAPESIGLLRELRAGAIPRADSKLPVLVVGADDDSAAVRYYRAGADVALPTRSSPLLVAAGLEALARRTAGEQRTPADAARRKPDRRLRRARGRNRSPAR